VAGGIEAERLAREAGGDHGLHDAERRERVLAAGLQHDRDLHHEGGQPQRIHPGRIAGQEDAEAAGLREEVNVDAVLADEAAIEELERHAAGEPGEDGADVGHRGMDLAHVLVTEGMRQAGELRQRGDVILRALQTVAVAPRQVAAEKQLGGLLAGIGQLGAGDGLQTLSGTGKALLEIAADEPGVRHAHGDLAAIDVEADLVEALVGAAEAKDRNVDRGAHGVRGRPGPLNRRLR